MHARLLPASATVPVKLWYNYEYSLRFLPNKGPSICYSGKGLEQYHVPQ